MAAAGPLRVPVLEGGRNFRDLGGYEAADGRRTRWGLLFRSGTMAHLTAADHAFMATLGLRAVCDLRTTEERAAEPYDWCAAAGIPIWSRDYATSFGELRRLMATGDMDGERTAQAMIDGYRELPFEQAPGYAELFARLAAGDVPLVFNCTAGKDRAGTGAAILLEALGVPRATVLADYALTDRTLDRDALLRRSSGRAAAVTARPPEVLQAIFSCDPRYIAAALDSIGTRHGSIETYLRDVLAVDEAALAAIRNRLLE